MTFVHLYSIYFEVIPTSDLFHLGFHHITVFDERVLSIFYREYQVNQEQVSGTTNR